MTSGVNTDILRVRAFVENSARKLTFMVAVISGSCAMGICEPGQGRNTAALSGPLMCRKVAWVEPTVEGSFVAGIL